MLESNSGAFADAMNSAARIALLESENQKLRAGGAHRERCIRLLEETLRVLQADRYGAKREKVHIAPGQSELFNEPETILDPNEVLGAEVNVKATPEREGKSSGTNKPGRKAKAAICRASRSCTRFPRASVGVRAAAHSSRSAAKSPNNSTTSRRRSRYCSTCARSTLARAVSNV
jgi:hypothetical protein